MRTSAIATMVYFFLTLIYKMFGDVGSLYHTNLYWLYSSVVFFIILLDIRKRAILKIYSRIFLSAAIYWGIMSLLHIICLFKISLYLYLNTANKFTVGAATIILVLIYLTGSILRNDTEKQR